MRGRITAWAWLTACAIESSQSDHPGRTSAIPRRAGAPGLVAMGMSDLRRVIVTDHRVLELTRPAFADAPERPHDPFIVWGVLVIAEDYSHDARDRGAHHDASRRGLAHGGRSYGVSADGPCCSAC